MKRIGKRSSAALLVCSLLFFGCSSRQVEQSSKPTSPASDSTISAVHFSASQASSAVSSTSESAASKTDLSLSDWWKDYLCDAVYIFDSNYPSMMQLDTSKIITYCGMRMVRDGLAEAAKEDVPSKLTKNDLTKYTQRYFNKKLSELDIVNRNADDLQHISQQLPKAATADESLKNGIFTLKKAEPQPDGTVLLTVEKSLDDDVRKTFFTMAPHKDGEGWYFAAVEQEQGDLPSSIKLSGSYQSANTLLHQNAGAWDIRSSGEIDGKLLFSYFPDGCGYVLLSLIDSKTMQEQIHELKLNKGETFLSARAKNGRIVVVTSQRILSMDGKFADQRAMEIPASLKSAAGGEVPNFDLSADRKKAVFSGEKGLMLYDFGSNSAKLLAEYPQTIQPEKSEQQTDAEKKEDESVDAARFGTPAFYDNDRKVQAPIQDGVYLYDLETGEGKTYDQAYAWVAYAAIIGNRAVGFHLPKEQSIVPHVWMDLVTEELHALDLPSEYTEVQLAPTASGLSMLAMSKQDHWQLFHLNMETMLLEKGDFSIEGIKPIVYGATENGKVLLGFFDETQLTGQILLVG